MTDINFAGDVSVYNVGIWSNGTGSGRQAFAVTQRFGSTSRFHPVQGEHGRKYKIYNIGLYDKIILHVMIILVNF